jgi:ATP-dependent DNA helicase
VPARGIGHRQRYAAPYTPHRACVSHITLGKFKAPIGSNAKTETRQTIAEMAAQLLELESEHIEVVQSNAAGKRSVISDAELEMLLDCRKEVFEGRGVG